MKNKQRPFEVPPFEIKLPPRPDYARLSRRQLLRESRRLYAALQRLWTAELQLPTQDWFILESISRQMMICETMCPEVCEI